MMEGFFNVTFGIVWYLLFLRVFCLAFSVRIFIFFEVFRGRRGVIRFIVVVLRKRLVRFRVGELS